MGALRRYTFSRLKSPKTLHGKPAGMGSLDPKQLLILNGVNTNFISRSLQNVLTNFLILRCVMMEKGPM